MLAEIKRVLQQVGAQRAPSHEEFNRVSRVHSATIVKYFGTWEEAMRAVEGASTAALHAGKANPVDPPNRSCPNCAQRPRRANLAGLRLPSKNLPHSLHFGKEVLVRECQVRARMRLPADTTDQRYGISPPANMVVKRAVR